jgi:hypothetical protein
MIADHKDISILCDNLREKGNQPVSTTTFSDFLKASRPQKDPRTIAKNILPISQDLSLYWRRICSTRMTVTHEEE